MGFVSQMNVLNSPTLGSVTGWFIVPTGAADPVFFFFFFFFFFLFFLYPLLPLERWGVCPIPRLPLLLRITTPGR
jgi:hypothetical protein